MERTFISAEEAIKMTEEAEKNSKENAKAKAWQILEELNFNEKVQEAARDKRWKLWEPIFVEDYDVANAICEIMNALGYTAQSRQHNYGGKCYRIVVSWPQVLLRGGLEGQV